MPDLQSLATMADNHITRLELIGPTGRVFNSWEITGLFAELQDGERTLKIFFTERMTGSITTAVMS